MIKERQITIRTWDDGTSWYGKMKQVYYPLPDIETLERYCLLFKINAVYFNTVENEWTLVVYNTIYNWPDVTQVTSRPADFAH